MTYVSWPEAIRIISARLPRLVEFDDVADPSDLITAVELGARTSSRGARTLGNLQLVPPAQWMLGEGAGFVMPAFTFPSPFGSRFAAPGSYGVFYAGESRATAVAESSYHFGRVQREFAGQGPAPIADMRVLVADIQATVADIRTQRAALHDIYDPDDYAAGQAYGARIRATGTAGIAYDSVRRDGGECMAVFAPACIRFCAAIGRLTYTWDGTRVTMQDIPGI